MKKSRTRIDTPEQINTEMKRLYRLHKNRQLSAAELKIQIATLVALRGGLAESVERPKTSDGWTGPPTILAVPSGCFLSMEQIAAHQRGEPFVDPALCTPFEFEDVPSPSRSVVPFPRSGLGPARLEHELASGIEACTPEEQQLLDAVGELLTVARQLGLTDNMDAIERALHALNPS